MKVLIFGVSSVQSDALKILKELGYETYACAKGKDGSGAEIADHFDIIDILDIEKIATHIRRNEIDAVYSVGSDLAMPIACKISEELFLPHFVSSKVATTCNNKHLMRETLGMDCAGNIPFQVIENKDTIPEIRMPYIMKPVDSQGQRGIVLINSLREYQNNFDMVKEYSRLRKVIVEKYVDGPELSVNVYIVDNKLKFLVVSDRETWPQYTGLIHKHIVPSKVLTNHTLHLLKDIIEDACRRIGISNGPAYVQMKLEAGKPYIIEMTPRLDGCHMWKLLLYHTGVNLLKLSFEHLLQQDTSELDKRSVVSFEHELEFFCQQPNTIMNQAVFSVPQDAKEHSFYYNAGETIRPINGKYEKVGYFIRA